MPAAPRARLLPASPGVQETDRAPPKRPRPPSLPSGNHSAARSGQAGAAEGQILGWNSPCVCELGHGDWQSSAGPAGTYWIFLVKFLETIPPSTCCSSCLPAGKANTPHQHLSRRLFFPQQTTATTKPNRRVFRAAVSLPQCKLPLWGGLRKPPHVGREMLDTAQPHFQWKTGVSQAAKSWSSRK